MISSPYSTIWSERELVHKSGEENVQKGVFEHDSFIEKFYERPSGAIRRVNVRPDFGQKVAALTFDICETPGESAGYDGRIVDILRERNVEATFFICGKWLFTHRVRAKQLITDPLFELGSHTWDHANLKMAAEEVIAAQLDATHCAYCELTEELKKELPRSYGEMLPSSMRLFRFPYGRYHSSSLAAVASRGMQSIQWDVFSGDPDPENSAEAIAEEILSNTRSGSIIICHANGRGWNTAAALPRILDGLQAQNFSLVKVSSLLKIGDAQVSEIPYERVPGDNDKYDKYGIRTRSA
ncbi:polysaccharide deacetylase family protein [Ensifer sp. IC4062]|nr:polysaccharide deacetylase family protein [Ensifer sp. IC4062]